MPNQQASADTASGDSLYTSPAGFSLRYGTFYIGQTAYRPTETGNSTSVTLTYPFPSGDGGSSTLTVLGGPDSTDTPLSIVQATLNKVVPNGTTAYQIPNAYVGYWPGSGVAEDTTVVSSSGSTTTYEVVIMAAVRDNYEITVVAIGQRLAAQLLNPPQGTKSPFDDGHPSPAALNVSYVAGDTVNSITFPASSSP
jgi:hypothetical protein